MTLAQLATLADQRIRNEPHVLTECQPVTLEETRAVAAIGDARSQRGGTAGGVSHELKKVLAYRQDSPGPTPISDSKAFTDLRFTRDGIPGTTDRNRRLMTGSQCNHLVAHGGRLYAAVSPWNHDPAAANPGPAVLVKISADAPWDVVLSAARSGDRQQSTGLFRYPRRRSAANLVAQRRNLLPIKGFHLSVGSRKSGCKETTASVLYRWGC